MLPVCRGSRWTNSWGWGGGREKQIREDRTVWVTRTGIIQWNPSISNCGHPGDLVKCPVAIEKCPYFRGKFTAYLGHSKVSLIQMCPYSKGVL